MFDKSKLATKIAKNSYSNYTSKSNQALQLAAGARYSNSLALQMITNAENTQKKETANNTGIPMLVKRKFETSSGFSFDDVQVHYNSDKPSQLQALAYTQGNQVYIGPGQERHLGHELGHVVQQKQGIVKTTEYLGQTGINTDSALEKGADKLAQKIMNVSPDIKTDRHTVLSNDNQTVQRVLDPALQAAIVALRKNDKVTGIIENNLKRLKNKSDSKAMIRKHKGTIVSIFNNYHVDITEVDIDDIVKIVGLFMDYKTEKELVDKNERIKRNDYAFAQKYFKFTNCFFRIMSNVEKELIVKNKGLVGNHKSLTNAIWIVDDPANTHVKGEVTMRFEVNMVKFLQDKMFVDFEDDHNKYGEADFPECILYKNQEKGCIGIGVYLLDELNQLINGRMTTINVSKGSTKSKKK